MKRIISVLMAAIMIATMLCGCTLGTNPTQGEQFVKPDFSTDAKLNLSWMVATQSMLSVTETPAIKYAAEKFNVTFSTTELSPADHDVQLELNISGEQIKNIVTRINANVANEYGSYGAFLDLRPYIENGYMPNVKAIIDRALEENPNNASLLYDSEGHIFRIPSYTENPIPIYNFSYNKAAFAAVGYENPQTWEDVYNALVAIKAGREDFYPFKMRSLGSSQLGTQITDFIISFTGGYANGDEFIGYDPESDKFEFAMQTDGYKEAIQFFNKMYTEGLIDPGYSTASASTVMEAMKNGECVMTCDYMGGWTGTTGYEEYTAQFVPMHLPQAEGQSKTHGFAIAQFDVNAGTSIASTVADNPVLLGRVLQFLDYLYSDEFTRLVWYHPDVCKGSYPDGITDPTQYVYEKDENGNYIYQDRVYDPGSVADMQNIYFCWSLKGFHSMNDPVCNKNIAPYDSYYQFCDELAGEKDKFVHVPLPAFKPSESKKISACTTNCRTVFNMRIADLLTKKYDSQEAFDAAWDSAVNAVKSQGADTLVDVYNSAYQRSK